MKIAIYGGAFNPVHKGHIEIVRQLNENYSFDKILVIPSKFSPHKSNDILVSDEHRLNMCRLAFSGFDNCEISDIEIRRNKISFTVDTLTELKMIYPFDDFYLVCGSDMFLSLHSWKNYEEIFSRAIICAVPRENDDIDELIKYSKSMECYNIRTIVSDKFMMNVSSTEIRNNIANSIPVTGMVGKEVEQYIYKNKLYLE